MPCIYLTLQGKSKIEEIEGVPRQTFIFEEDQKINCWKNQYSVLKIYDSVRKHQPEVSYLPTIPFGSINPKSRIFQRFRSGASTRSLVSFYDSIREHQPEVSYPSTIPFGRNDPESRIFFHFHTIPSGSNDPESRIFFHFI